MKFIVAMSETSQNSKAQTHTTTKMARRLEQSSSWPPIANTDNGGWCLTRRHSLVVPKSERTTCCSPLPWPCIKKMPSLHLITVALIITAAATPIHYFAPSAEALQTTAGLTGTSTRLCVTFGDYNECLHMSNASSGTLTCVRARDRYECMKHIIDNKADIVNLNNEELYLAGRLYNLEPFAMEEYDGDTQHYKSVVLINSKANINSISDLKGKRSCHGAYNSTSGWHIPVGLLLATLTMSPVCQGELYTVGSFFEQSCAPEKLHPNLCAACQNSTECSASDDFAGEDGALRCLFTGYGQVAFVSSRTVDRLLSMERLDRRLLSNFVYLCMDGSQVPLNGRACEWAHKPTNVFVTAPNRPQEKILYLAKLRQLFLKFVRQRPRHMQSLFSDAAHVTDILAVPSQLQRWDTYLGNYISSIEKPLPNCEPNLVTLCTSSAQEELKCLDLQKAAFSRRIRPEIECRRQASKLECLESIASRQSQLALVEMADLYGAPQHIVQLLEPVALAQAAPDYSVAVVRADSPIKFLQHLAGRKSCHAAFGDLASWLAPLSVLSERSLLDQQQTCNKADQMADFFGGSCVPGAADLRINQYRSGDQKLCALCRGNQLGEHQCERSTSERYFGASGALRCLVEGAGEVAFMSLSSLVQQVDGRSRDSWARSVPLALDKRNFRLLCRTGSAQPLAEFERCHLARLPDKLLLTNRLSIREDKLAMRRLVLWLVEEFGSDSEGRRMFELFGLYQNESNLLFDDSTSRLLPLRLDGASFDSVARQHFDASLRQLSVSQRASSNCKLVLATTSGAASLWSVSLLAPLSLIALAGVCLVLVPLVSTCPLVPPTGGTRASRYC